MRIPNQVIIPAVQIPSSDWYFRSDMYGNTHWYNLNGNYHRDNGPAIICANGTKIWCHHGLPHRIDGPALESHTGSHRWFYKGKELYVSTLEEFQKYINNKAF